ncbi:MAG: hypothetical protein A2234_07265 [Elusimicrobia bacterium RIFOXYA2_FULL_58_8]|nr:MAG: hypothetical protein A2234_07265 [Elusimicrobia bacterium RIFOXYA2_FULL_58_8]OGS13316.1 MAG: hypothetical protein A2285_02050 [Elusimicrobia bacterium RIFOXYA12_FULL_57_11]
MRKITVIKPDEAFLRARAVRNWPVWESPVAQFDWQYGEDEACLFLEGKAVVSWPSGSATIAAGDFVVFPKSLSCRWEVLEPVKKHYKSGIFVEAE